MTEQGPILLAYKLDGQGGGIPLEGKAIANEIQAESLAWVHLDANHQETRSWLEREVSYLDNIVLEALLAEETRPRMEEFENGAIIILRGVNLNEDAEPEDMVSIRIWVDEHRIISLRKRRLKAVMDIEEKLQSHVGPKDAGEFVGMLATRLFQRMEPVMHELDEQIDNLEERVLDEPDIQLRKDIVDVRKRAILLRRYMAPQRDAIAALRGSELSWISTNHKRVYQENYNRLLRYVEDLDAVRERAQIVQDELTTSLADKLNKNMYVLSVVAAIFLPLGFFTGLFGINVDGMPGADNVDAFNIFCIALVVMVVLQVMFFRWKKWI